MLRFLPRGVPNAAQEELASLSSYTDTMARLLFARGIQTAEEAERYLNPRMEHLHDPFLLHGLFRAEELLLDARDMAIPTMVYGDYDVDGMCAAAIMADALRRFGIDAQTYIPLREEGYGLNKAAVERIARDYRLLITVDLGVTNHAEVRLAQEMGMKVIVTDHHQPALEDSPADAVISPLMNGYPCSRLCGAGVALKTAQALLGMKNAEEYLDLAALATVADIVPLTGENRAIVSLGLPLISQKKRHGIRALMEISAVTGPADTDTLGFQLAPRLNAAGRLKDAKAGLRLLLTRDAAEADAIASELNTLNANRKRMENDVLSLAETQVKNHNFTQDRAFIVRGEGWHLGVIGLVAGRLSRRYACPAAVLSEEKGLLHGSLRSVPGLNIHRCLQSCDDLLLRYGGHEQAAGVTLTADNYEAFCKRLKEAVSRSSGEEAFIPCCEYDLPLRLSDATDKLITDIRMLAPFGCANPAPLFLTENAKLVRRRACGETGAHLQVSLRDDDRLMDGIAFHMGGLASELPDEVDAVFSLSQDCYRGVSRVQCRIQAIRPAAGAGESALKRAETAEWQMALLAGIAQDGSPLLKAGIQPDYSEIIYTQASPVIPSRGVLYIARTRESALALGDHLRTRSLDLCWHKVTDPLCLPTLLVCPRLDSVSGLWSTVWLLDGEAFPGEAAQWKTRLPGAEILTAPASIALRSLAAGLAMSDAAYRTFYRLLCGSAFVSLAQAARAARLSVPQIHGALLIFQQLKLIDYNPGPFAYAVLPPKPCKLDDSPLLAALRRLAQGGRG